MSESTGNGDADGGRRGEVIVADSTTPGGPSDQVHEPELDDREPRTRRPMFLADRFKVLALLAVFLFLCIAYEKSDTPIMSWGDAARDQIRAKRWVFVLAGLEVVRQVHYVISEHSARWHRFWQHRVFGGWERRMSRLNPYTRFRLSRLVKRAAVITLLGLLFSWMWGLPFFQALAEAPVRIFKNIFVNRNIGLPLGLTIALSTIGGLIYLMVFFGVFFIGGIDTFRPGEIRTRFRDIWGQDHVVRRVKENLDFLEAPEQIEARGGYVPGGILLWGPPGTGKTLLAEASAGETGKPYVFVDPQAFVQTFIGVAPMKIKHLYRKLRKQALRYGGVVVFFDEADVLGNRGLASGQFEGAVAEEQLEAAEWLSPQGRREVLRSLQRSAFDATSTPGPRRRLRDGIIMAGMASGGMGTLPALLTEMNGLNKPRGFFSRRFRSFLNIKPKPPPKYRILHIFATNLPSALDAALLRPGRIDRMYKVGFPMKEGRIRTYEGYFAKIRHTVTADEIERLATMTPGATGASIKDLVNEAVLVALRDGRDVVTWNDVITARYLRKVGEHEQVEFVERERHAIAIHEACHAVTARLERRSLAIDFVSIEPGGGYLGVVMSTYDDETFLRWRSTFEIDVLVSLASLAGERMFFDGDSSAGVSGDLRNATLLSTMMEAAWGMGDTVAAQTVLQEHLGGTGGYPTPAREDDATAKHRAGIANRIEMRLDRILERATALLAEHRVMVLAVAHALETHKTISGDDVAAIFEGRQGPRVDGRAYHHPSFLAVAEAYHVQALEAHRQTGQVDLPLPVLAPPPPRLAAWSPPVPIGTTPDAPLRPRELPPPGSV
jgi:cell division protease FtsH